MPDGRRRRRRRPDTTSSGRPSFSVARSESPARLATSFFADTPFSGQVNLLTTGSFDTPAAAVHGRQLRRAASPTSSLGAPVGDRRRLDGARRAHAGRHRVVDRGRRRTRRARRRGIATTSACRTARSATTAATSPRCATSPTAAATSATLYGFDTFALTPAVDARPTARRYARYDYLERPRASSARASR